MKLPDCNNRIGNWLNLTNSKKIPRHLLIYKNALENLDRFSHLGLSSSYLYRYKNWKDLAIFQDKWGEFVRTSFTWKLVSLQLHLETRRFVQKYMKSSCTVQFKATEDFLQLTSDQYIWRHSNWSRRHQMEEREY